MLLHTVSDVGDDEKLSVFQLTTDDHKIIRLFELSPTCPTMRCRAVDRVDPPSLPFRPLLLLLLLLLAGECCWYVL
jgi:hypothetical protein